MTKILAALLLISAVICSCTKKDEPAPVAAAPATPVTPTKTELLIEKNWGMTAGTVNPAFPYMGFSVDNLFLPTLSGISQVKAIKDDTIRFAASNKTALNGTYTRKVYTTYGSEKDEAGTWKFNADQTQIIFTSSNSEETTFDLISIEAKKMVAKTKMGNPIDAADKAIYTVTATFSAK